MQLQLRRRGISKAGDIQGYDRPCIPEGTIDPQLKDSLVVLNVAQAVSNKWTMALATTDIRNVSETLSLEVMNTLP